MQFATSWIELMLSGINHQKIHIHDDFSHAQDIKNQKENKKWPEATELRQLVYRIDHTERWC